MTQREIGNIKPLPKREALEERLAELADLPPLTEKEKKQIAISAAVTSAFMFSDDVSESTKMAITQKLHQSDITKPDVPDF